VAIDPDYSIADAGLRPGDALTPTVELAGATPLDAAPLLDPRRKRRIGLYLAVGWLACITFFALGHSLLPLEPYDQIVGQPKQAPCFCLGEPLGTDAIGRSVTSRLAVGARQSLFVAVFSVGIAAIAGTLIGVTAGYWKGWTDRSISLFVTTGLAFPPLVLLLALTAVLTPSLSSITSALAILFVFPFARLARANTFAVTHREFVLAARVGGARHGRILLREIVPNVAVPLISYAFIVLAAAMVAEGSLAFLGFGIPPPQPTWGGMIAAGRPFLATAPQLVFIPCLALLLTVLSLNAVGDAARRRFEGRSIALA
jgi:peptide/nickel transport system permease protein